MIMVCTIVVVSCTKPLCLVPDAPPESYDPDTMAQELLFDILLRISGPVAG